MRFRKSVVDDIVAEFGAVHEHIIIESTTSPAVAFPKGGEIHPPLETSFFRFLYLRKQSLDDSPEFRLLFRG